MKIEERRQYNEKRKWRIGSATKSISGAGRGMALAAAYQPKIGNWRRRQSVAWFSSAAAKMAKK
jgi:hypothetical protein